jgi:hypothetical protein
MRLEAGGAAVVLAAGITLICAGPTSAQQGDGSSEPLDVSPTSGPPGTVITVRGGGCFSPGEEVADVELFDETTQQSVALRGARVGNAQVDLGSWSAELTVPAGVDPDDAFVVTASCATLGPEDDHILLFDYEPVAFDVTGASTTSPPTSTPPITTPPTTTAPTTTAPAPPARAPAAPAEPVVAAPAFTG